MDTAAFEVEKKKSKKSESNRMDLIASMAKSDFDTLLMDTDGEDIIASRSVMKTLSHNSKINKIKKPSSVDFRCVDSKIPRHSMALLQKRHAKRRNRHWSWLAAILYFWRLGNATSSVWGVALFPTKNQGRARWICRIRKSSSIICIFLTQNRNIFILPFFKNTTQMLYVFNKFIFS